MHRMLLLLGLMAPTCLGLQMRVTRRSYVDTVLNVTVISPAHPNHGKSVFAVPALFGPQIAGRLVVPVVNVPLVLESCDDFAYPKPILSEVDQKILSSGLAMGFPAIAASDSSSLHVPFEQQTTMNATAIKWLALIARGGCAFDSKVFNGQEAGYDYVSIYNDGISTGIDSPHGSLASSDPSDWRVDVPIRMAASTSGGKVKIPSMFMTYSQVQSLIGVPRTPERRNIPDSFVVSIEPVKWDAYRQSLNSPFENLVSLVLFYVSLGMLTASILMSIGIVVGLCRNYFVHGQAFYDLDAPKQLKMKKVDFPLKHFREEDIIEERPCCAICIDDFCVGDKARMLPCGHQFHDTCVDPWLMRHNRLCPICKQDVVILAQQQALNGKNDELDGEEIIPATSRRDMVRVRVVMFLERYLPQRFFYQRAPSNAAADANAIYDLPIINSNRISPLSN